MAVTITRTMTNMLGTPASPASLGALGSTTSTLDHTAVAGTIDVSIGLVVTAGTSAPTTNVTIRFAFTEDGSNYVPDGADISLAMANSTAYSYRYDPPPAAKGSSVTVTNGATNGITLWCQGTVLSVS